MTHPHAYTCRCIACRLMAVAIKARTQIHKDDVFTDMELATISRLLDRECECKECEEWRRHQEAR